MYLSNDLNPTADYTRILNDVIFDDRLSHAEFRVWCRLLALPKGAKQIIVDVNDIAQQLGMSADLLRTHRRNLKAKGFLTVSRNEMIVTIPTDNFEPEEVKLTKEQQERHDLRDTWNANKPDSYSKQKHPVSEAQVSTLRLHASHNDQEDLCAFLVSVLNGCKADDWWKEKNMNFTNVFGSGTPKQNKFTNVEKLVKLAGSKKGQAALFDANSDQSWIDWFQSKTLKMDKVVRLEMGRSAAWTHQVDNDGDGTIYIYTDEDCLVHWTYKENDLGVSYLPTAR
jgi:hypothetical protein